MAAARAVGVSRVAVCGTGEADWGAVLGLAARHPEVIPCLGLHPWKVATAQPGWEARLEGLLHTSGAALEAVLDAFTPLPRPVMVHAFGGSAETARAWAARGLYLSFTPGAADRPRLVEALKAVPLDRLLLESDGPGAFVPADLPAWVARAAALRGESEADLGRALEDNGRMVFP